MTPSASCANLALARNSPECSSPGARDGHRFVLQDASGRTLTESPVTLDSESGLANMSGFFAAGDGAVAGAASAGRSADRSASEFSRWEALSDDGCGVSANIRAHTGLAPIPDGETSHPTSGVRHRLRRSQQHRPLPARAGDDGPRVSAATGWWSTSSPHTPLTWLPFACQRLGPARPTTLVPAGPGRRRWEFMIMPTDDQDNVENRRERLAAPRTLGDPSEQRRTGPAGPGIPSGAAGPLNGAGAAWSWPVTLLIRCRRSWARASTPASATRPIWPWRLALLVDGEGTGLAARRLRRRTFRTGRPDRPRDRFGRPDVLHDRPGGVCSARRRAARPGDPGDTRSEQELATTGAAPCKTTGSAATWGCRARWARGPGPRLLDEIIPPPSFVLLGRDGDPVDRLSAPMRAAWQRLGGRSAHFGPGGLADSEGQVRAVV